MADEEVTVEVVGKTVVNVLVLNSTLTNEVRPLDDMLNLPQPNECRTTRGETKEQINSGGNYDAVDIYAAARSEIPSLTLFCSGGLESVHRG